MLQAATELSNGKNDMVAIPHQNHQTQLKILFDLGLQCQALQYTYKYYVYVTKDMEIILWIHPGKNTAIDKNLDKSGKELS